MTDDTPKLLFIGATGNLGEPVARAFIDAGVPLRVLARSPERVRSRLGDAVEVVQGDVLERRDVEKALDGCSGVYLNLSSGKGYDYEQSTELNGVKSVLLAAADKPVQWIGYISGSGHFEAHRELPPLKIKLGAERLIEASGIPCTLFKPTHFMESLPMFVREGKATVPGKQPQKLHYLAAEDYARLVVERHARGTGGCERIICLGPEAWTMNEALKVYSHYVLDDAKVGGIPLWLMRLIGTLSGNESMKTAAVLFSAFQEVDEAPPTDTAGFEFWYGATRLEDWCKARAAAR